MDGLALTGCDQKQANDLMPAYGNLPNSVGGMTFAAVAICKEIRLRSDRFCGSVWPVERNLLAINDMWIVYALTASLLWGVSYAASGRVMERGMTPLTFFFCYALFGVVAAALGLAATGKLGGVPGEVRSLGPDGFWFAVAVVTFAGGALLIFLAIGEKNATLASLIEISYPFFVAVFAWLFFRETQFNWPTIWGGVMILGGVAVVFLGNRD